MTPPPPPNIHVAGVPLHFPHTPYRAQNALMHAVVTAVNNRTHTLIESPTGTGKSVALLCATLAVQAHIRRTHPFTDPSPSVSSPPSTANITTLSTTNTTTIIENTDDINPAETSSHPPSSLHASEPPPTSPPPYFNPHDSDSDDFQPRRKFRDVSWQRPASAAPKRPRPQEQPENAFMLHRRDLPLDTKPSHPILDTSTSKQSPPSDRQPRDKIPRIFYATRTHNQLAHIVAELRKTNYTPRMSMLASRREYCIRDDVKDLISRDEVCKRHVSESSCSFFRNANTLASHEQLRGHAWDIEELVNLGQFSSACPYYASHELYQNAELVLCPYSYLIDPVVRGARGIDISGDVIVLDEAHNIENYALEAASFEVDFADLRRVVDDVDTMLLKVDTTTVPADLIAAYQKLRTLLEALLVLTDNIVSANELEQHFNFETAVFDRKKLLEKLCDVDINSDEVMFWRGAYDYIANFGDGNEAKRVKKMGTDRPILEISPVKSSKPSTPVVDEDMKKVTESAPPKAAGYGYGCDPVVNSSSQLNMEEPTTAPPGQERRRGRKIKRRGRRPGTRDAEANKPWLAKCMNVSHSLLTTLAFLFEYPDDFVLVVDRRTVDFVTAVKVKISCLNAAICFRELSTKARSVIVASGTLSPMASFAGELGTEFAITKSLPHVINVRKQLYVGVVATGSGGVMFDATFHGAARFEFQDGLGEALVDYARVVPGGMLVFFPSYRMMDNLRGRWAESGIWESLLSVKSAVLVEPTKRGEEFDHVMEQYQAACSGNGAVLFAVCRGKLSEGVDFKDEMSRAVVIIGIPFPFKGDVLVNQKRMWNDRGRNEGKRKDLQSGAEWYEMQAYRALNQAVGRAVRHRYDYGAILLIDGRFRNERVLQQLPKWTRNAVNGTDGRHQKVMHELGVFYRSVQSRVAEVAAGDQRGRVQQEERESIG